MWQCGGSSKRFRPGNPFKDPYLPTEDWKATKVEIVYHPVNYRTQWCNEFFKRGTCKYESWCAFAHAEFELQSEVPDYEQMSAGHGRKSVSTKVLRVVVVHALVAVF